MKILDPITQQKFITKLKELNMFTYDDLEDLNENIEDMNEHHYSPDYWAKLVELRNIGLTTQEDLDSLYELTPND